MSERRRGRFGRILLLIGRLTLGAIFVYAAYTKMAPQPGMPWTAASVETSLSMFAMGVDSYQMLRPWAVEPFAHLFPPAELILGFWLISGVWLRLSGIVASGLIAVFIMAMYSAYERHLTISCGCFGPGKQIGPQDLARDGLLFLPLALAVTVGAFLINRKGTSSSLPESASAVTPAS